MNSIPDKAVGFVYCVTQKSTGMKYLGKKLFHRVKTFQVDSVKKKKVIESEWREYWGSSPRLKETIKEVGLDDFERIVLQICYSKTELSYTETLLILLSGSLVKDDYFNDWVTCKITKKHLTKVRPNIIKYLETLHE